MNWALFRTASTIKSERNKSESIWKILFALPTELARLSLAIKVFLKTSLIVFSVFARSIRLGKPAEDTSCIQITELRTAAPAIFLTEMKTICG